jgi:hypothetical protein
MGKGPAEAKILSEIRGSTGKSGNRAQERTPQK